jgi:hypothetical protein
MDHGESLPLRIQGIARGGGLRSTTYLKFKGQVLIVNPMNRKIVDMFAET